MPRKRRRRKTTTTAAPPGSTTEDPAPVLAPLQVIKRVRCGRCHSRNVVRMSQWRDGCGSTWVYYRCRACVDSSTLRGFTFKVLRVD